MLPILLAVIVTCVNAGGGPVFIQDADGSGSVGYTPPDLNDENTHSRFLPDRLRCQGCTAVAYQLFKSFRETDRKRPSLEGRFPESLILKITEHVCEKRQAFEKYGLKMINEEQELFGPGMGVADDAPSVRQEGGMWPSRLRDMCTEFIDNLGDHELYLRYLTKNSLEDYTNYLCYNTGVLCGDQTKYKVPEKIQGEDIYSLDRAGRPFNGEFKDYYYADEYEEDYDEDYYESDEEEMKEEKHEKMKK